MKGQTCNCGLMSPSLAPFQTPPLLFSTTKPSILVLWCCYSAASSCPTLCDPMNCSTPGFLTPKDVHIPHWIMPNLMVKEYIGSTCAFHEEFARNEK